MGNYVRIKKSVAIIVGALLLCLVVLDGFLSYICFNQDTAINELHSELSSLKQAKSKELKERESLLQEIELLQEKTEINDRLLQENNKLRTTIKTMSFREGVSRSGVGLLRSTPLEQVAFQEDLGVWRISYYTPTKEECGSNSGITTSGRPVIGAYTCAADTSIWPMGTVFYVEGWGLVEVMDTGGVVKGRNRLDICLVTSRDKALRLGIDYHKVWLVNKTVT